MPGRVGDTITDPTMVRCQGCGQSELMCQVCWDAPTNPGPCCRVCTCIHISPTPDMVDR